MRLAGSWVSSGHDQVQASPGPGPATPAEIGVSTDLYGLQQNVGASALVQVGGQCGSIGSSFLV